MSINKRESDFAKRLGWGVILTTVTVASTLLVACGTPFVALATLGALFLPRRDAVVLIAVNWLANQTIGFAFLHYPHTWECYRGGLDIGFAAVSCVCAALLAERVLRKAAPVVAALGSFAVAFVTYEGLLYAISPHAHAADFALPIVGYIFLVNSIAFVGLLLIKALAAVLGFSFPLVTLSELQRRVS
jgi:hypothetical protein